MAAKYILAALAAVFLAMALVRMVSDRANSHPQTRTWLLIGLIFGTVSAWLWMRG
jgi:hypothetical protein